MRWTWAVIMKIQLLIVLLNFVLIRGLCFLLDFFLVVWIGSWWEFNCTIESFIHIYSIRGKQELVQQNKMITMHLQRGNSTANSPANFCFNCRTLLVQKCNINIERCGVLIAIFLSDWLWTFAFMKTTRFKPTLHNVHPFSGKNKN